VCGVRCGVKERSGEGARKATNALDDALARSRGALATSGDEPSPSAWLPSAPSPVRGLELRPALLSRSSLLTFDRPSRRIRMSATQIGDELVARGMDNMEVRGAL
jgi:hypothetical protein